MQKMVFFKTRKIYALKSTVEMAMYSLQLLLLKKPLMYSQNKAKLLRATHRNKSVGTIVLALH